MAGTRSGVPIIAVDHACGQRLSQGLDLLTKFRGHLVRLGAQLRGGFGDDLVGLRCASPRISSRMARPSARAWLRMSAASARAFSSAV